LAAVKYALLQSRGGGVPHLRERRAQCGVEDQLLEVRPGTNSWCKKVRGVHPGVARATVRVRVRRAGSRGLPLSAQYCEEHFPQTWRPLFAALAAIIVSLTPAPRMDSGFRRNDRTPG